VVHRRDVLPSDRHISMTNFLRYVYWRGVEGTTLDMGERCKGTVVWDYQSQNMIFSWGNSKSKLVKYGFSAACVNGIRPWRCRLHLFVFAVGPCRPTSR
jgi:hypothetical protein